MQFLVRLEKCLERYSTCIDFFCEMFHKKIRVEHIRIYNFEIYTNKVIKYENLIDFIFMKGFITQLQIMRCELSAVIELEAKKAVLQFFCVQFFLIILQCFGGFCLRVFIVATENTH